MLELVKAACQMLAGGGRNGGLVVGCGGRFAFGLAGFVCGEVALGTGCRDGGDQGEEGECGEMLE
jgi:hypothetical protein